MTVSELMEQLKKCGDGSQKVVIYIQYADKWHDIESAQIDPYGYTCELKINPEVSR